MLKKTALLTLLGAFLGLLSFDLCTAAGGKKQTQPTKRQETKTEALNTAKATETKDNNAIQNATAADQERMLQEAMEENARVQPQTQSKNPASGERIDWDVISSGGGPMTSTNYQLDGTLGQTAAGESSVPGVYVLNSGYWQNFEAGPAHLCGDANGSTVVNLADIVFLVQYIFNSGPAPIPLASGDANCSTQINLADCVYLVQYIFNFGPPPCDTDHNGTPDC